MFTNFNMDIRKNYLNQLTRHVEEAKKSNDVLKKAGSFLIYSNLGEFLIIQGSRICELLMVREMKAWKIEANPHLEKDYFNKRKTRSLLSLPKMLLKLRISKDLKKSLEHFLNSATLFLDKRNSVTHNLCHPDKYQISEFTNSLKDAEAAFDRLKESQRNLVKTIEMEYKSL